MKTKQKGKLIFASFEGRHGYGHKHLHKAPELPQIIRYYHEYVVLLIISVV